MENLVYNELLIRGYNVDVGVVDIFDKDKAVSYTHLDVYKRQLYDTGAFGEDRERSSKGDAQETPAGRIQNAGTGS